jgi:hypothetical protein
MSDGLHQISCVADELWVCNRDHTVKVFDGDFEAYREMVLENATQIYGL